MATRLSPAPEPITNDAVSMDVAVARLDDASCEYALPRASAPVIVAAICAAAFFFQLGAMPFVGPDEPRYAEIAREMLVSGDYITPRLCGALMLEKPVLLYWMQTASYRLLGVSEIAARLPSAAAALLCVIFVYFAIGSTVSRRLALIVSSVLCTSAFFVAFGRVGTVDMVFTSGVCVAITCYYLMAWREGRVRTWYCLLGSAAMGAAVLAKGLTGIVLVAPVCIICFAMTRQPRKLRLREIILPVLVFAAVVCSWYLPVTVENGTAFLQEFIVNHHFKRFLSNRYSHPQPFWFFVGIIPLSIVPWTFFLLPAAARLIRSKQEANVPRQHLLRLAWIWLLFPTTFFSLSGSKLPGYILPALPALAIIVGIELEEIWQLRWTRMARVAAWLTAVLMMTLGIVVAVVLRNRLGSPVGWQAAALATPIGLALLQFGAMARRRLSLAFGAGIGVLLACIMLLAGILAPRLDDELCQKHLAMDAAAALMPGERVAFYQDKKYAAVFYAQGRVLYNPLRGDGLNAFTTDEIIESMKAGESLIVITSSAHEQDLRDDKRLRTEPVARQASHVAMRVALIAAHPGAIDPRLAEDPDYTAVSVARSAQGQKQIAYVPDPKLTPGDALPLTRDELCARAFHSNVPAIPISVKTEVFERYRISTAGSTSYQVDHLIPIRLGGSNSVRNLWPQPLSGEWNHALKNRLERRLRRMVCNGKLTLEAAQREIASDWIKAYQRYVGNRQ